MTIISLKYSFENCFWDPSWNLYEKLDREAYRRRNGTTAAAAARGCARWLLHHFLLLPRQLLLFFFLPLAAGLPLSLAALNFSLVSFVFSWFLLIFPLFFFSSFFFLFFFSLFSLAEMNKWADQLLLPQLWTSIIDAYVAKCVAFNDISQLNV